MVAAFYPLQFLAERVGGDAVRGDQPGQARAPSRTTWSSTRARSARSSDAELVALPHGLPARGGRGGRAGRRRPGLRRGRPWRRCWPPRAGGHDHDRRRRRPRGRARRRRPRTRTSGSTRPGWPPSPTGSPSGSAAVDPDRAADYTARAAALRAELETAGHRVRRRADDLPAPGDRGQPRRVRLPRRAVPAGADRHHRAHPGGRAVPAAAGRGRRGGPGAPAPPRSSSRRWSARRWPRPSPGEVGAQTAVLDPLEGLSADGDGGLLFGDAHQPARPCGRRWAARDTRRRSPSRTGRSATTAARCCATSR